MTNETGIGYQGVMALGAKKTLATAVFAMSLGLAGCGSDDDNKGSKKTPDATPDTEQPRQIKLFEDDFEAGNVEKWKVVSVSSSNDWKAESFSGNQFAVANCYQADAACDDWMISPELPLATFTSAKITFTNAWKYGTGVDQIALKVSTDFSGDPATATWTDISDQVTWSEGNFAFVESGEVDLSAFVGNNVRVAFHYAHAVDNASKWEIDNVVIEGMGTGDFPLSAEVTVAGDQFYTGRDIAFNGLAVNGAGEPFTFAWDFGDGNTSADAKPVHAFAEAGRYQVDLTVTDKDNNSVTQTTYVSVQPETTFALPAKAGDFRIATFNAGFDKQAAEGEQATSFAVGDYRQAQKVAEIIQRSNPDILLLNEIDGNDSGAAVEAFKTGYLEVAQADGVEAVTYDHVYYSECNTGLVVTEIEADFNNDDVLGGPDDRYGFGNYNGQYCMAIFSKYEIDTAQTRTFQKFLWKDMPEAQQPVLDGTNWYSAEEWNIFRLSSKTHIDLPINVNGTTVHVLASHPTPPVFDGKEDRNGLRNFDEIRLWADYIDPASTYLYDDMGTADVTLAENTRFVIMGDENASSVEGDAAEVSGVTAINQLLDSPLVNPNMAEDSDVFQVPTSAAGAANRTSSVYASTHTAGWAMRADYVLPSAYGLKVAQGGVFWPQASDDLHYLVTATGEGDVESSDHRMVWMDLEIFDGTVTASGNTANDGVVLDEDFKAGLDDYAALDYGEDQANWYSSDKYGAVVSCYRADEICDDWLVIESSLEDAAKYVLNFDNTSNFGKNAQDQIRLLISTNYTGDTDAATWDDLTSQATWTQGGSWSAVNSGDVDLSAYAGQIVFIAFHYTSAPGNNNSQTSTAATWQISNLTLTRSGGVVVEDEVTLEEDFKSGLDNHAVIDQGEDQANWYSSDKYGAVVSCYRADEICDDWLVIDSSLGDNAKYVLNFDNTSNFGTNAQDQIRLLISTNYTGDTDAATWDDLTSQATWTQGGSWSAVNSGDVDLSAYAGQTVYIAFQYVSTPGNNNSETSTAATWQISNLTITKLGNSNGNPNASGGVGETILADTAPVTAAVNDVNKRVAGTLEFAAVAAPANEAEKASVIGSTGLTIDGTSVVNSGYKTLMKSGDLIGGNVYGQIKDDNGSDLFVSNYNEFTSILPVEDRVFAISQFESIPGGIHLVELSQDATTGELTPLSTELIDMSSVDGNYNHCAAMVTPWNTHLASEEYEPNARQRSDATGEIDSTYYDNIGLYHASKSLLDINPYWYGYAVEVEVSIDDSNAVSTDVQKHYAMGRTSIEIAYAMPDRKTVYLTDDGTNGGLYMFVADTEEDLSAGHLYAMKWNQTNAGSDANAFMGEADIEWIALGHATNDEISALIHGDDPLQFKDLFDVVEPVNDECPLGYNSINHLGTQECLNLKPGMEKAASRLETRRYAALMGATVEMRKEEGFTYNPHNHKIYMAIADIARGMLDNNSRDIGGENHMQLSTGNTCGGLYELSLGSNDDIGSDFVIGAAKGLIAGVEAGGACDVDTIAGPDNVAYVGYNTLIITEDTSDHENNFVWSYNLETEALTRIFSAPALAENTGPYMFHNVNGFSYITNVVQHPADEKADPSEGNEAEVGYFGPIPYVEPASSTMSVSQALAVDEDQKVVEVVGVITSTVVNQDYALELADENDSSQVIIVKLNKDDRALWGPKSNPGAAGTAITVIGERDLDGYSGRQSIEGSTEITAR